MSNTLTFKEKEALKVSLVEKSLYEKVSETVEDFSGYIARVPLPTTTDFALGDMTFDLGLHDLDLSSIVPKNAKRIYIRVSITSTDTESFVILPKDYVSLIAESVGVTSVYLDVATYQASSWVMVTCQENRKFSYYGTVGGWTSFGLVVLGWEV